MQNAHRVEDAAADPRPASVALRPATSDDVFAGAKRALDEAGTRGVLEYLNAATRYRFTGLYRVDPPLLKNICLFDRENPTIPCSGDVSMLDETYCCIVAQSGEQFFTLYARSDVRLSPRGVRNGVISYAGVPVTHAGAVVGTLCHFDLRPRLSWPHDVTAMETVAPLLVPAVVQVSAVGP